MIFLLWLDRIQIYINRNKCNVYAEEALNEILEEIILGCTYYNNELCGEIDTIQDLNYINNLLK